MEAPKLNKVKQAAWPARGGVGMQVQVPSCPIKLPLRRRAPFIGGSFAIPPPQQHSTDTHGFSLL